ncbi:ParM/StbA family protein [Paenibacillus mesophilus]|uniref:ParM/StbA family protein n=1 Tax=Paenibacillus mesophilus TaxID=2582849 RepID=UPI00110F0062|nr:ParM/StbA family protein [Paenibacillus mesophilus]TMV49688.1 ParM/StbA family protein [Paenibacillus mesophilus]
MIKLAGIDVGNDSVKVALDGSNEPILVPNVVAPGYDRHILQEEDSPLKALDVVIQSPKLGKRNQRYFVGLLAVENQDNTELEETDNKALSDQSLVVALTALAYAGVKSESLSTSTFASSDEVEYIVGTGLPVRTYAKFNRTFEERLVGEHEVTFLSTPQLRNRRVKVIIRRAIVSIEGAAALYHISTYDSLQIRDEEVYYGCIGVCEIGALTTDFPVVKRMSIDNQFSTGEQMGIATYLDPIMRDIEDLYGYRFPSRAKLVQRIRQRQFTIQRVGEGQADIKPIVDQYFGRAAVRIVEMIKKRWNKYPDIQCFYVIGGGAAALKPYLLEAAGSIRLRFVEDSELQNMYGYLKLAKSKSSQPSGV